MPQLNCYLLKNIWLGTFLVLSLVATPFVNAYGNDPIVPLSEILSPELIKSQYHRVEEVESREGAFYFRVTSDYGTYDINSLPLLRERVKEIKTLGIAINELDVKDNTVPPELRGQLTIRSDHALDILAQPVSSARNITGQLVDNLNETLTIPPTESQRSFQYSGEESTDPTIVTHKHNVAGQWNLDVFSTNTKVQEYLGVVASMRSAGNISAGTASLIRPAIKSLKSENKALDFEISLLIKRNSIEELQQLNAQLLETMLVSKTLQEQFFAHPFYSPRHWTKIVHYLSKLDNVENRSVLIQAALQAKDEHAALVYEQAVATLLYYHQQINSLKSLESNVAGIEIITNDDQILILLLADIVSWTKDIEQLLDEMVKQANSKDLSAWGVITAGLLTKETKSQLQKRKLDYKEKITN